jgi:phosphate transport system permease protein
VIAPFVQRVLPATLTAFYTIPLALLAGAYVWQLVPQRLALRVSPLRRFALICLALPLGAAAAIGLGPFAERILFAGDVEGWLDGRVGGPLGGWVFLLLPLSIATTLVVFGQLVTPWLRRISLVWDRTRCASADLVRFVAAAVASLLVAVAAGWALSAAGLDPRGSIVDTYVQRNALVVGFVMGFAIIPLIYTLAEDALTSVPGHLRLASLGAGATTWQTAMRVVLPTAASGLFSAIMVGLGRAVGETMVVLMAAGNTPVLDWNAFNGFRTLSANIAVELPEAVEGSTHYRTLFLAALVLFAMTFVINTAAELVRRHFRARAYQL